MKKFFFVALAALPAFATAEIITFEADSELLVVRRLEGMPGSASFDVLGSEDGMILCVAMDAEGKPLATATCFVKLGGVVFEEISVSDIDRVSCRYTR